MQRVVGARNGRAAVTQLIWPTRARHIATVKKAGQPSHPLSPIQFSLSLLSPKLRPHTNPSSQYRQSPPIGCVSRSFATKSVKSSSSILPDVPPEMAKAKGKGRRADRKKKDPNAPKRSLSAYMFFANETRDTVREENENATFGMIGKMLGERWKSLSAEDRGPFEIKAAADKKRYEDAKAAYLQNDHHEQEEEEEEDD